MISNFKYLGSFKKLCNQFVFIGFNPIIGFLLLFESNIALNKAANKGS